MRVRCRVVYRGHVRCGGWGKESSNDSKVWTNGGTPDIIWFIQKGDYFFFRERRESKFHSKYANSVWCQDNLKKSVKQEEVRNAELDNEHWCYFTMDAITTEIMLRKGLNLRLYSGKQQKREMRFGQSQRENSGSITSKSSLRKVYSLLVPNVAEKSKRQNIEKKTRTKKGPRVWGGHLCLWTKVE